MNLLLAAVIAASTVGILELSGVHVGLALGILIGVLVGCVVALIEDAS